MRAWRPFWRSEARPGKIARVFSNVENSTKYLTGELEKFKSIEDWIGKTLTDEDLDRGIEIMDTNRRLMATEDAHEGLAAFMEKRAPVWKDR